MGIHKARLIQQYFKGLERQKLIHEILLFLKSGSFNKYIVQLLRHLDCVIIPDFGGFVAQYKTASLDGVTGYSPPSKQILFNINLKNNDGLLANKIARNKIFPSKELLKLLQILYIINIELKEKKHSSLSNLVPVF